MRDTQAGVPSARRPGAQLAFKDSMVHGILQFTPGIAFRCVLHRCESRDIRCRESFSVLIISQHATPDTPRTLRCRGALGVGGGRDARFNPFPWRDSRRGGFVRCGHRGHTPVRERGDCGFTGLGCACRMRQ